MNNFPTQIKKYTYTNPEKQILTETVFEPENRLIKLFSILLQIDQRIQKESNESINIRDKYNTSKA